MNVNNDMQHPISDNYAADSKVEPTDPTKIGAHDVLCGRNKAAFNNPGNRRFRFLVSLAINDYVSVTTTRKGKSRIIRGIIETINNYGGRFLQERAGGLEELSQKQAYEKVGHALRDMVLSRNAIDDSWKVGKTVSNNSKASSIKKEMPESDENPLQLTKQSHEIGSNRTTSMYCGTNVKSNQSSKLKQVDTSEEVGKFEKYTITTSNKEFPPVSLPNNPSSTVNNVRDFSVETLPTTNSKDVTIMNQVMFNVDDASLEHSVTVCTEYPSYDDSMSGGLWRQGKPGMIFNETIKSVNDVKSDHRHSSVTNIDIIHRDEADSTIDESELFHPSMFYDEYEYDDGFPGTNYW